MQLSRIVIFESAGGHPCMVFLREVEGDREFPIVIGMPEAWAIQRRTKGAHFPRPMTHDLIVGIMDGLEVVLEQIVISELRDSTFYAKLVIRQDGRLLEIDSRPSDALAIGAGTDVPLFVDESVLKEVC
jgi:hypothetical protein